MNTAVPETQAASPVRDGSLVVLPEHCKFSADRRSAVITVTSENPIFPDAITELSSVQARNLAMAYAASQGVGNVCMNDNIIGPYPVNGDGVSLEQLNLPPTHPDMRVGSYRVDVKVCTKF